jgi:hypothetical protein
MPRRETAVTRLALAFTAGAALTWALGVRALNRELHAERLALRQYDADARARVGRVISANGVPA